MSAQIKDMCCLLNKVDLCVSELGYKIVLKSNKGYCTDIEQNKLNFLLSLKDELHANYHPKKTVKNNLIHFCGQKVFVSKNNSLFLDDLDSKSCQESELTEECCIDLCAIEAKINSICNNC